MDAGELGPVAVLETLPVDFSHEEMDDILQACVERQISPFELARAAILESLYR